MSDILTSIIVYQPDNKELCRLIRLYLDYSNVLLYFNSKVELKEEFDQSRYGLSRIGSGENIGIAAASNACARYAVSKGYKNIMFLDQDTFVDASYLSAAIDTLREGAFAVFPNRLNISEGESFKPKFIIKQNKKLSVIRASDSHRTRVEIEHEIASGMVVNVQDFLSTGGFDEDLFIDWVDTEWCWRQRLAGRTLIGLSDHYTRHKLGDSSKSILGINFTQRSSIRDFFNIRNGIILARRFPRPYSDYAFKVVLKYFILVLFASFSLDKIRACLKGAVQGMRYGKS